MSRLLSHAGLLGTVLLLGTAGCRIDTSVRHAGARATSPTLDAAPTEAAPTGAAPTEAGLGEVGSTGIGPLGGTAFPPAAALEGTPSLPVPSGHALDLAQLIRTAASQNPRLGAARARWMAARQRPRIARSLPDPMLTYTEMLEPIQTRVGPLERSVQLRQVIPFPGKLSAAGAVADEKALVKEIEYHIALRDIIAEVKVSFAELIYLERAIRIVEQNEILAKLLSDKANAAGAGGLPSNQADSPQAGVSRFDALKAEQSLAQLAYDKITLRELLSAEQVKLNTLLGRQPTASFGVPTAVDFRPLRATQAQLFGIARERRQEIQAAIHKVRAAGHGRRLARLSRVPDFSVGLQYSFIGDSFAPVKGSGQDAVGLMFGVTLPIWARKNRARIEEACQLERAAKFEQRAVTDDVMARISKIYVRMANAERLARLYRESLIPQVEQALQIAEQWHEAGRETYGRLLEARGVWLNFLLAGQRAMVDHEQMVARLEQLVGISLGHLRGKAGQ